jgi:4-amino-4-deoxy-L-arabinose transferase-like glycosyltransferase
MQFIHRLRSFFVTTAGRRLAVALGVGCALRLALGLWTMRATPVLLGDQYSYWYFGNEIAHSRGYLSYAPSTRGQPTSYYPVGYPALLGVVYWFGLHTPLPNDQPLLTMVLHLTMATATIALVYFIAHRMFSTAPTAHRIALIAAWIVALFPSLIAGVGTYSLETTFIFFTLLAVSLVIGHDFSSGPMSTRRLVLFGTVLGLSALVRPFSLPLLAGVCVALWCVRSGWRPALRQLGMIVIVLVVVFTPWTIRNERTFGKIVPFSTNLGDGLCMSRFPGSNGQFTWATHAWCADSTLPEAERNPANTRAAIRFVLDHPGEELRQIPHRFLGMMEHDHATIEEAVTNGSGVSTSSNVYRLIADVSDWYFSVVCLAALVSVGVVVRGWRRDRVAGPRRAIVAVLTLFLVLIPVGLWGNPRFHVPFLPLLAIFAAAGASWLLDWGSARPGGLVPGGATLVADEDLAVQPLEHAER